ncbi:amidohydrolase family protein [Piscinibacter sp.]|uniref:amidohydrolase family protein n=1 Tax=Piscinibacter sp. TaxID=1903157 RepID=UPI002BC062DD|nr:amidohydrolase family protein [Albitalea sp.]HUG23317.1 amidohydrolase family protein [Albitalea sp.]
MSLTPRAIVDSHHHLWDLRRGRYPWLQDGYDASSFILGAYAELCRDFGPAEYRAACADAPVVATVHVEAERARDEALAETAWLHELNASYGMPDAVVAYVDLAAADAGERLAEQAAFRLLRGIRCKPRTGRSPHDDVRGLPGSMQDPRWLDGLSLLEQHGLSWDLRVPFWHLDDAAQVARAFPRLAIVLEHAGLPWDRSAPGLAAWRHGMAALAACPNVHVKLSEFGLRDAPWRFEDNAPIVRETVAFFGWRRCMFGSNFPVASLRIDYPALVQAMSGALAHLEPLVRQAIWHDNAAHFYRIPTPQQAGDETWFQKSQSAPSNGFSSLCSA